MTREEMQGYLEHLAGLPDAPDLPEEEEAEAADTADVQIQVVSVPPGRLRRVHTNGLWWAGLPELFADVPAGYRPPEDSHWPRLAFLLASALVVLGQELAEAENFAVGPHQDSFLGRPVQVWLTRHEPPDEELRRALGTAVDTVIRVECSLWAEPGTRNGDPGDRDPRAQ